MRRPAPFRIAMAAAALALTGCAGGVLSKPTKYNPSYVESAGRRRASEIMRNKTIGTGTSGSTHVDYGEAMLGPNGIQLKGSGQPLHCSFSELQPEVRAYGYVYLGPACPYGIYTQSVENGKILAQILYNLGHAPAE